MTDNIYTPKISITNNDPREIDNLTILVWFQINGQTYFSNQESHGTFNNVATYGLTGEGGTWNASENQWTGNFLSKTGSETTQQAINVINKALAESDSPLDWEGVNGGPMLPNLQILMEDSREFTGLNINVEFSIAGEYYTDTLALGDSNLNYGLALTGMGGTKGSNDWWTGNFLTLQYPPDPPPQNDAGILLFLDVLYVLCVFGAAAAEGTLKKGFPIKGNPNYLLIQKL